MYTLPIDSQDERLFVLAASDLAAIEHVRDLEQVLTQILGRKVAVFASDALWPSRVPFE